MNSRMGGRNKAFLEAGGKKAVDRVLKVLKSFFNAILLSTRQPDLNKEWHLLIVQDIYPYRSSMTGIQAGLKYAKTEFASVVPSDAPSLQSELISLLRMPGWIIGI
jgi:molybdopterin-guanine dinucleotide biosynthesis protein A